MLLGEKIGQLRDVRRYAARFIFREQFRRRSPARFVLEVNKGQLLAGVVLNNKARL
jgi:hypothetical protein